MTLLLDTDPEQASALLVSLGPDLEVLRRPDELDQRLRRRPVAAVVIGPGLALSEALTAAHRIRTDHPATTVVLSRHEVLPEMYAHALEAGVGAVVAVADHDAMAAALSRARLTWQAISQPGLTERPTGRVVTVFSPKGGVGKTTMTVNIALALRAAGSSVCVVDLDLAFGDVAITMQLIPSRTVADAAGFEDHLDWSMLRELLTEHRSGIQVLAAPTNPEGRERITAGLVRTTLQVLRDRFDHVVVDTPPGFDDQVLGAFDETDDIVVVATLDVPTIKNVKVALETLDLLQLVRDDRHLVLNRADEEVGLDAAQVEDLLGVKVELQLPSDTAVASATNHGDPIVSSRPDHAVARAIAGFCGTLPGGRAPAGTTGSGSRRSRFGLRRKVGAR